MSTRALCPACDESIQFGTAGPAGLLRCQETREKKEKEKKKQSLFDFFWWKKRKDIRSNAESSFVRSAGEAEHFVIDLQIPERRMQVRMKINWRADDSGGKHGSGDTNCWT